MQTFNTISIILIGELLVSLALIILISKIVKKDKAGIYINNIMNEIDNKATIKISFLYNYMVKQCGIEEDKASEIVYEIHTTKKSFHDTIHDFITTKQISTLDNIDTIFNNISKPYMKLIAVLREEHKLNKKVYNDISKHHSNSLSEAYKLIDEVDDFCNKEVMIDNSSLCNTKQKIRKSLKKSKVL